MELETLLERLQSKLIVNDKRLAEMDASRTELKRICQEEQDKISTMCTEVQARVGAAGESLKVKMITEFNKLDDEMTATREKMRKDSLVLCPELEKITELMKTGEGHNFDIEECWAKIKNIVVSSNQEALSVKKMPKFHPSKTLAKVKSPDLGFLNVADYLPSQYQLALTSSASNLMEASMDAKAICTVTTDQQFTEMIQANIKFSIKNKACKEAVPYCKEECKLSEDKRSFQIAFMVQRPGMYVVTVLLYDQHVADSPLTLVVSETQLKEKFLEMSLGQPAIPQRINPPVVEPIDSPKQSQGPDMKKFDTPSLAPTLPIIIPPTVAAPLRQPVLPPSMVVATPPVKPSAGSSPSLPPGPLNLSHITPGGRLAGLRMLSIEEGAKEDSLHKPIGMCLLQDGNIVVASTFEDKVKIFTPTGKFVSLVTSPKPTFDRPSDMVTLQSGQFVVRDNSRVQVFSASGVFTKNMMQNRGQDKCYGLAQDKEGRLITIMESRRPRKTDLLFFDLDTGDLVKKIEMEEIIANMAMSKCRFLTYQLGKLYITDLGLDCVYILDPITINAKVFGSSGSGAGQLSDPAGLVVDSVGNIIVADSKNHRLCLYSAEGKFVCNLSLSPDTRRPSGVALDKEQKDIYVLNLQGRAAMTKYRLK